MIPQRARIALDAAFAGSDVGHLSRGRHVACLALLSLFPSGTLQPLGVRGVHRNSEDNAFVTRGTVSAFLIQRRVGVLSSVDVVKWAEKDLSLARPQ